MPHADATSMSDAPPAATRRGRAILYGVGLDRDGHARCTLGNHFRLVGGSADSHAAMRRHADALVAEIERHGYSLENLGREDVPIVRRLIARYFAERRADAE